MDIGKLESPPKMEGKQLIAYFLPDKNKIQIYKDALAKSKKTDVKIVSEDIKQEAKELTEENKPEIEIISEENKPEINNISEENKPKENQDA